MVDIIEKKKPPVELTVDDIKSFANPNCKKCWGKGFEYLVDDKNHERMVCRCVQKNMMKTTSKIKF